MFHNTALPARAWAMALALGVGLGVAPASPAGAQLPVPAYQSTFDGYRTYTDSPIGGWAAANRGAADIGGWKAYAKADRAPSSGSDAATSAAGAHNGHTGHGTHPDPSSGAQP